ncbi:DUF4352 domain-containing protein [Phytohabitans suffuscus]|uniref:DUF4352 domain-containing protein n=1 Tax=Phytohabitans suffuscus TaxID=624315 RepID=A0A6F8YJI3_9ACTN|nr:DUF4352 domain-containing protein [Phytohabitans suffuscus]BCB86285.1 hypothetical protein Psuf_035980 [Phytohabitans suffuscus]
MEEPSDGGSGRGARIAVIVGAAIVLISLCCCAGAVAAVVTWGDDAYRRLTHERGDTVAVGQAGRDGVFEFTVGRVDCGVAQIGDSFVNQTAVGQFCLAELSIQNVGKRPATFADALQRAYAPDGDRYAADSAAGILANSEQQLFQNQINPGNRVTGVVVYDIPRDSRIAELELHESEHTAGLRVKA